MSQAKITCSYTSNRDDEEHFDCITVERILRIQIANKQIKKIDFQIQRSIHLS